MNDERPIEKLLRRAAKKRRDEASSPPKLHPANRRLLQDEVVRQFPKPGAAKPSALAEFWAGLTQRRVYLIGVFAVLGLAAIAILPIGSKSKPRTNLAQSTPSGDREALEFAKNKPLAPEPVATPAVALMEEDSVRATRLDTSTDLGAVTETAAAPSFGTAFTDTKVVNRAIHPPAKTESKLGLTVADVATDSFSRATPATTPPLAQPSRKAESNEVRSRSGGGNVSATWADSALKSEENKLAGALAAGRKELDSPGDVSAVKSAIAPTGAAPEGLADKTWIARSGGSERERAAFNSQAFSNINPAQPLARQQAAPAVKDLVPVLANFRIEEQGRALQVVDGDGSVYRGVVDEENTLYKQKLNRQNQILSNSYENKFKFQTPKLAAAPPAPKPAEANYYLFRVEGTNRSLNQNVVFTWNFVDTNALAVGNLNYQNTAQKLDAAKLPSQFPALLQNSFINGRAEFGEGREVEVNAVPVKP